MHGTGRVKVKHLADEWRKTWFEVTTVKSFIFDQSSRWAAENLKKKKNEDQQQIDQYQFAAWSHLS